jgi:hypothetical protein
VGVGVHINSPTDLYPAAVLEHVFERGPQDGLCIDKAPLHAPLGLDEHGNVIQRILRNTPIG